MKCQAIPLCIAVVLAAAVGLKAEDILPQDIVNVVFTRDKKDGEYGYQMDGNRCLVVTDIVPTGLPQNGSLTIVERLGKETTAKATISGPFHSKTGLVFRPGATLLIESKEWDTVTIVGYAKSTVEGKR